ncbi:endolytic transglycosylase MltG [Baekduia soli]|uniref:Endolytic murein transglycosylase n=1 Tax=Baekduia soli TaxID=496014 RepID=A0A5B8U8W5_9ACTN|nr:endolytic transglycosylase MltG [Baekduia soli]QEC49397.1 endolytic transglycosylase MltG [Baekduia soli]
MTPLFGAGRDEPAQTPGERSAAEREAARLERERRRAEREGRAADVPAPTPAEPVAPAGPVAPPEPVAPEPVAPAPAPPAWEADPAPLAFEPVARESHHEPRDPRTEVHDRVTVPPAGADGEAPAPLRRAGAPSVRDLPQVAGPRHTAPAPVPFKRRGLPNRRRTGRRFAGILVLVLLVAVGWFAYRVFQPFAGAGDAARPVRVTVPQGSTATQVADLLEQRGVIDSAFYFGLRARISGRRGDLKAGTFTLRRDMSYAAALDVLTRNPKQAPLTKLTIPEGRSIGEEAPLIRSAGLGGSYLKAATRDPRTVTGFKGYGVPKGTRTLEGFLFPATYELRRGATASDLVAQQLATFRRTFDKLDLRAARRKNLSAYDVLIIASMIEREAQVPKDRRLIAAVIYNRLKRGDPLGIDATLRYALKNWSRPLRQSELQSDSVFNTRRRTGLPPTPIGSPGLASIQAALRPASVPYLFYVVKPCGNGAHAFSSTDAQFQKDVAAYNAKRAQLGGKDPSHC